MAFTTPPPQPVIADELDFLASGSLSRRGNGGGNSEAVSAHAWGRQYIFRQNADYESLIAACTCKLAAQPDNMRALMIRGNTFVVKGEQGSKVLLMNA
jgi:hypothetical protein